MPPLLPTAPNLTIRLTAHSDSNKSIQQLIQRLARLDFQPGSQPLNTEEGDVRLELSAEIHESLKGLEEDLDLVRLEAEDFINGGASGTGSSTSRRRDSTRDSNRESERSRVAVLLARLTEDLKLLVLQTLLRGRC
jgi:protein transport protein SEC20